MVRRYVRKKPPPAYGKDALSAAVDEIKSGHMTVYRAAKTYLIPKSTLQKHVTGQRGVKSQTSGRPPALPYDVEKTLADYLKVMEKWGFGLSKKEVLQVIAHYVKEHKLTTPFRNCFPGDDYFAGFMTRFNLSQKKPQAVEVARKRSVDPFLINDYFELLKQTTENVPPGQIYNIDETGFCLDPTRVKVVGEKGTAAHRTTSGPGRETMTVLMGGNATGEKLPPLIVFKGKNIWDSWMPSETEEYPGMTYAATQKGWMDSETFHNYFRNSFLKSIPAERPVVLIYDGHVSHISIALVQTALQEKVVILKLPAHTSHLLQPMDLCVFHTLKLMWDTELIKWQRKNFGQKLPKSRFAAVISSIWRDVDPKLIIKGFEKAGIHPVCGEVIPTQMYDPGAYKRWCAAQKEKAHVESPACVVEATALSFPTQTAPASATQTSQNPSHAATYLPSASTTDNSVGNQKSPQGKRRSFEELLLEHVKQTPHSTPARKKVCSGAAVITSASARAMLQDKANKEKNVRKPRKKNGMPEDSDEDSLSDINMLSDSDEFDIEDELQDAEEEAQFMDQMSQDVCHVGDWILAKFAHKKSVKMYVAQITATNPMLEAKFARRIGSSWKFHWPNVQDISVIQSNEVFFTSSCTYF